MLSKAIVAAFFAVFVIRYANAECQRKEMDFDLYCKVLCNPCKNDCHTPCVGNLTNANCESTEVLALSFHSLCDRIRQVDACDIAAACCRTDLRPCAVSLYNSITGSSTPNTL